MGRLVVAPVVPAASTRKSVVRAFAFVALTAALGGCIVVPAHRGYGGYGGYGGHPSGPGYGGGPDDAVAGAPPPVQYEVVGVAPHPGWFWISGFWTWRANRHVWVGGRWDAPRPGYRWQPHRWEPISSGRGWRERPGGWHR
jgi:WXXGXW repeat (2 copies)